MALYSNVASTPVWSPSWGSTKSPTSQMGPATWPLPSGKLTVCYWKWPSQIVDLPMNSIMRFHMLLFQRVLKRPLHSPADLPTFGPWKAPQFHQFSAPPHASWQPRCSLPRCLRSSADTDAWEKKCRLWYWHSIAIEDGHLWWVFHSFEHGDFP